LSPGTLISFINKTDCHKITEILLKVALNIIPLTHNLCVIPLDLVAAKPFLLLFSFVCDYMVTKKQQKTKRPYSFAANTTKKNYKDKD
jgi:hypothetical protein